MHQGALRPTCPRFAVRVSTGLFAALLISALLGGAAGVGHAAVGATSSAGTSPGSAAPDATDTGSGAAFEPAPVAEHAESDGLPPASLPAGALAAALLLAGAATVVATRAMCSGRGWR